jgi:hypothetical protein
MPNFTISFKAMGSHIQVWLNTPTLDDAQILQEVPMWFEAWEQQFSRFRTDSDLSELNRRTGQWVEVAPDMFEPQQFVKAKSRKVLFRLNNEGGCKRHVQEQIEFIAGNFPFGHHCVVSLMTVMMTA